MLNDIILPPWANNSPEKFIQIQRNALESEYVSTHLHHWIDLIFGMKQRPPFLNDGGSLLAVKACNVFFHITYEGAVDMDVLKETRPDLFNTVVSMLKNYGQTPPQVFKKGHPPRTLINEPIFPLFSNVPGLATIRDEYKSTHSSKTKGSKGSKISKGSKGSSKGGKGMKGMKGRTVSTPVESFGNLNGRDRSESNESKSSKTSSSSSTATRTPSGSPNRSASHVAGQRIPSSRKKKQGNQTKSSNNKKSTSRSPSRKNKNVTLEASIQKPSQIVSYPIVRLNTSEAPVLYACPMPKSGRMITIDAARTLCLHKWTSQEPDVEPPFTLEIDPTNVTTARHSAKIYQPRRVVVGNVRHIGTPFANGNISFSSKEDDEMEAKNTNTNGSTNRMNSNMNSNMNNNMNNSNSMNNDHLQRLPSTHVLSRNVSSHRLSKMGEDIFEESRTLLLHGTTFRVNTSCFTSDGKYSKRRSSSCNYRSNSFY